ncbi:SRPBCC domain-containing protein [Nocardia sp. CDC159]|uniref:SRPBCC domain-containing protein n=1 Tax=Nocardia pulmonis TaxID=2951408 RepID=A0A9X2IXD3_9NOCA|nr:MULTISPECIES: SRPBCC domain-containing protein [Nocardia]MCM6775253.1 SRPBCC domain-containing protein [Nocardia pulmonis]MCM6788013.1 SRPBCC domain-containing protein [Nocardia sp. CDC159]
MMPDAELNPAAVEIGSFFPQLPDAVWRALTEPDVHGRWLMPSTGFEPSVGTHFILTAPKGEIACEVLTVRPIERLTFSWIDLRARHPARWVVDWTVRRQGRGTRLLLTQTGFDLEDRRQQMARHAMERGWRVLLARLREELDRTEA